MASMLDLPTEDDLYEVIQNLGHFQKIYNLTVGDMMSGNLALDRGVESGLTRT